MTHTTSSPVPVSVSVPVPVDPLVSSASQMISASVGPPQSQSQSQSLSLSSLLPLLPGSPHHLGAALYTYSSHTPVFSTSPAAAASPVSLFGVHCIESSGELHTKQSHTDSNIPPATITPASTAHTVQGAASSASSPSSVSVSVSASVSVSVSPFPVSVLESVLMDARCVCGSGVLSVEMVYSSFTYTVHVAPGYLLLIKQSNNHR